MAGFGSKLLNWGQKIVGVATAALGLALIIFFELKEPSISISGIGLILIGIGLWRWQDHKYLVGIGLITIGAAFTFLAMNSNKPNYAIAAVGSLPIVIGIVIIIWSGILSRRRAGAIFFGGSALAGALAYVLLPQGGSPPKEIDLLAVNPKAYMDQNVNEALKSIERFESDLPQEGVPLTADLRQLVMNACQGTYINSQILANTEQNLQLKSVGTSLDQMENEIRNPGSTVETPTVDMEYWKKISDPVKIKADAVKLKCKKIIGSTE